MTDRDRWSSLGRLRNVFYLSSLAILVLVVGALTFAQTQSPANIPVSTNTPDVPLPSPNPEFVTATSQGSFQPTETAVSRLLWLNPPGALPTATLGPPTAYPLLVNQSGNQIPVTWGNYPGPTSWPAIPIPPPVGIIPKPEGQINILLLGNDFRRKLGARTDTVILLTLNPETGTASVTSFPRDLFVYAPGYTMMRINTVQPTGGYELLKTTFEYNFGVRPDFYVNISMTAFVDVIDSLGGINVYVHEPIYDPTFAGGKYDLGVGWVHMDGKMAKWYAQSRQTSSDFSRLQRQQAILEAIFKRLLSVDGISRADELYSLYQRFVFTDLELADVTPLIPLALKLSDTTLIDRYTVKSGMVEAIRLPISGAYVLIPNQTKILEMMIDALAP